MLASAQTEIVLPLVQNTCNTSFHWLIGKRNTWILYQSWAGDFGVSLSNIILVNIKPKVTKYPRYLGTTKLPPHAHQCMKKPHTPKTHACHNNNNNNKPIPMETTIYCSPYPPTCLWVGWVFFYFYSSESFTSSLLLLVSSVSSCVLLKLNISSTSLSSTTSNMSSNHPLYSNFSSNRCSML